MKIIDKENLFEIQKGSVLMYSDENKMPLFGNLLVVSTINKDKGKICCELPILRLPKGGETLREDGQELKRLYNHEEVRSEIVQSSINSEDKGIYALLSREEVQETIDVLQQALKYGYERKE